MNRGKKPTQNQNSPILDVGIALASQIGIVVIGVVLIAVGFGIWLDRTLNVKPIFTIILLLGSGPLSLYLVYRLATRAVAKMNISTSKQIEDDNIEEGGHKE